MGVVGVVWDPPSPSGAELLKGALPCPRPFHGPSHCVPRGAQRYEHKREYRDHEHHEPDLVLERRRVLDVVRQRARLRTHARVPLAHGLARDVAEHEGAGGRESVWECGGANPIGRVPSAEVRIVALHMQRLIFGLAQAAVAAEP